MVRIAGVASAYPPHHYRQEDLVAALRLIWKDAPVDLDAVERVHRRTTVEGRHLALPLPEYAGMPAWGEINRKWIRIADELGSEAVRQALNGASLRTSDVDTLVFVTVTGVSTPSTDVRIANRLSLRPDLKRLPVFGLGCVAGAAGLARAADLLGHREDGVVVLVSVELCSLTFQLGDHSMANVIATGLFGDGAAAVVLTGGAAREAGPRVVDSRSILYPDTERVMGWEISESGFRLVLSPEIPLLIRHHLRDDVDAFLAGHGLKRGDIGEWMVHTGGPKIFEAIEEALDLPESALDTTRATLRKVGNVSSASVLIVLQRILEERRPKPGTWGLMLAVGPGFCCELVLLAF